VNLKPMLVYFARLAVLASLVEAGTLWLSARMLLTPIQRHYMAAYVHCSLPAIASPSGVEVRWIWKTGPRGTRELASEHDAVSAPQDENGALAMVLSDSAFEAGWTRLQEGPAEQLPAARLKPALADLAFDGKSIWMLALLPAAIGILLFVYSLSGLEWLADRLPEMPWQGARYPWEPPTPSFSEKCAARVQMLRSHVARLHRAVLRCTAMQPAEPAAEIALTEPPARPASFACPVFGVHNGKDKSGYLWNEKDEIE
jgi:hypothetical protein